jgi:hypothetical protein
MKNSLTTRLFLAPLLLAAYAAGYADPPAKTVLVEAEGFDELGGWVIDQQYMDQMGSPVLLAHGLGVPVGDAVTKVKLPGPGAYQVWVRTRDWAATFNAPGTPGEFQVLVDGKPLSTTFGTERADWHWQSGGTIRVDQGRDKITLTLKDLRGFNGRCDAILLSADESFTAPDAGQPLATLRKKLLGLPETPPDAGEFDVVVVGGGIAGCCAAISAARLGLDVALIQNRPVLGGNNSSEIRVHLGGGVQLPPYPAVGGVVKELGSNYADDAKRAVVEAEENLHLFLNTHVFAAEKKGDRIVAVVGKNTRTNQELRFPAQWFADCTGDGNLGHLAGADYRYGRESKAETGETLAPEAPDRQTMGTSVMWTSEKTDKTSSFPETPWAIQFNERNYQRATGGGWNWETGFRWDQIKEAEKIRDHGLRAVFGNWSYQKNHAPDKDRYANLQLKWVAYVGGKRESRRLLGDVILQEQDVMQNRPFPDAAVPSTWWIDLHYPIQSDQFPGVEFRSKAAGLRFQGAYPIPYRCFYSRNIKNLFMAGRCISVTHVALGTVRVQRTCGMMGEVVGMAAAVCRLHHADPRDVYTKYLDDLKQLMTDGVSHISPPRPPEPPDWIKIAGKNLAREATVNVSSNYPRDNYPASHVNDGKVSYHDNSLRYVSDAELPGFVELSWPTPQTISGVRIVTGQAGGQWPKTPITDFVLQQHDGSDWQDIPGTKVTGNESAEISARFTPVTSNRIRLSVTASDGNLIRIWEFEAYNAAAE